MIARRFVFSLSVGGLAGVLGACSGWVELSDQSDRPPIYAADEGAQGSSSARKFEQARQDGLLPAIPSRKNTTTTRSAPSTANNTAQRAQLQNPTEVKRIAPGQELLLDIRPNTGAAAATLRVQVDEQGIADLGPWGAYRLDGLSAKQAQDLLREELGSLAAPNGVHLSAIAPMPQYFVQLEGRIYSPGLHAIPGAQINLAQAIAQGGNLLRDADMSRIEITRKGKKIQVDLPAMHALGMTPERILLQTGDSVLFPSKR